MAESHIPCLLWMAAWLTPSFCLSWWWLKDILSYLVTFMQSCGWTQTIESLLLLSLTSWNFVYMWPDLTLWPSQFKCHQSPSTWAQKFWVNFWGYFLSWDKKSQIFGLAGISEEMPKNYFQPTVFIYFLISCRFQI